MTNTEKLEQAELKLKKKVIDILTKEIVETNSDFSKWSRYNALFLFHLTLKSPNGDYLVGISRRSQNEGDEEKAERVLEFTLLGEESKCVYIYESKNLEGSLFLFNFFSEAERYFNNIRNEENALQDLINVNTTLANLETLY